jgi:release factor glutamine methyltransferase
MFVADNLLATAKKYFFNELGSAFSPSECKQMWLVLLEKRFGWSPAEQMLQMETRVSESDLLYFRSAVKRLHAQEPFQFVVGDTLFAGLVLKTDQRALIPRPETEELIELISKQDREFSSILDLCTGTGCIALALQNEFPNAKVRGLDLSSDAIALAQENALQTQLNVAFEVADVFHWKSNATFDLIVSNPPYIPSQEKAQMQPNVLNFEPHMALFVPDNDPLVFYKQIIEIAQNCLLAEGFIALEIHENFALETQALIEGAQFKNVQIHRDLQGKQRMILAQKA